MNFPQCYKKITLQLSLNSLFGSCYEQKQYKDNKQYIWDKRSEVLCHVEDAIPRKTCPFFSYSDLRQLTPFTAFSENIHSTA